MMRLADRIREAGDLLDECVIGWDSLNEPAEGMIGLADLGSLPKSQALKKGPTPTAFEGFRLGMGEAVTVDNWVRCPRLLLSFSLSLADEGIPCVGLRTSRPWALQSQARSPSTQRARRAGSHRRQRPTARAGAGSATLVGSSAPAVRPFTHATPIRPIDPDGPLHQSGLCTASGTQRRERFSVATTLRPCHRPRQARPSSSHSCPTTGGRPGLSGPAPSARLTPKRSTSFSRRSSTSRRSSRRRSSAVGRALRHTGTMASPSCAFFLLI
jgi:hypothetical protein